MNEILQMQKQLRHVVLHERLECRFEPGLTTSLDLPYRAW